MRTRLYAVAAVAVLFALFWLYVRELPVFSNYLHLSGLLISSPVAGLLVAAAIAHRLRTEITPWKKHVPEWLVIGVLPLLFAPLLLSLLNRCLGVTRYDRFEFVSEKGFYASNYGILKGEILHPSGYYLHCRQNGKTYRFQYHRQAYFPITKPGEKILLPVNHGLLGWDLMALE